MQYEFVSKPGHFEEVPDAIGARGSLLVDICRQGSEALVQSKPDFPDLSYIELFSRCYRLADKKEKSPGLLKTEDAVFLMACMYESRAAGNIELDRRLEGRVREVESAL